MKKNLLLLTTAFTLSFGVQAQTDVTAQYILNPGFEDCTPSESNAQGAIDLHTDYATALGTDYNDCGWKLVEQAKSANGGAISYASGLKVQYSKWNIAGDDGPTAGPSGTTGTKGLCFCGNKSVVYQQAQAITLPAGSYTLTVNVWARNGETSNPKPTQQVVNVRTGFMPEGGKEDDLIPAVRTSMQFASNGWDKEVLTIELTQATTGRFQLSYGSSYFVVIDDLKLEFAGGVVTTTLYNAIVKAQTLNTSLDNSTLATAIYSMEDTVLGQGNAAGKAGSNPRARHLRDPVLPQLLLAVDSKVAAQHPVAIAEHHHVGGYCPAFEQEETVQGNGPLVWHGFFFWSVYAAGGPESQAGDGKGNPEQNLEVAYVLVQKDADGRGEGAAKIVAQAVKAYSFRPPR